MNKTERLNAFLKNYNAGNLFFTDKDGKKTEFVQQALIELNEKVYSIITPVGKEESFVLYVGNLDKVNDTNTTAFVVDEEVIYAVFKEYRRICEENN